MKRTVMLAVVAMMLAMLLGPPTVAAAAPSNDLPVGAIALPDALPQTIDQDTTEATVTTDDVGCGAGGFDAATVWYTFSPNSDVQLFISTEKAGYGVGVNVFDTTADAEHLIACFGGASIVGVEGGHVYYLMFADTDGDATNGGSLSVNLEAAAPPIEIELAVDSKGAINKSGEATISGSISCSTSADFAEVSASLRQSVGRFTIHGSGFDAVECGPSPTTWKLTIVGDNGRFAGGRATVEVSAFACGATSCNEAFVTAAVRLGR
jgi:hypothetical protein